MTRCPKPHVPAQGREALAALRFSPGPEISALIEGAAGCSPYLKGLIEAEAVWLEEALAAPEAALEAVMAALDGAPLEGLAQALRQAKRRVALIVALADLAGAWPLEVVTGALTCFADRAVQSVLEATIGAEIRRGRIPGMTEADARTGAGMVVLAMGKMGAHELNYSSDIDLICLFDETRFDPHDFHEARAGFVRATRAMCALLTDRTGEGYVFRTDLRLRPDPSVTPVCMAMAAAETYYESLGRTWERAAYIKARSAAGDVAAGTRFLTTLRPFVWRKHLDFAAIEDAHNMRLRIRDHRGLHGPITLSGHNMKLGRGGIREIEFFTQTRQLISGGRDPDLRVRGTVEGLARLAAKSWVPLEDAERLTENYRFHREVEHRLQMLRDAQTHDLPQDGPEMERLAAFMGRDRAGLEAELRDRLEEVNARIERFFAPDATCAKSRGADDSIEEVSPDGLNHDVIARWPSYPALRSSRAHEIFQRLRPEILARLARAVEPSRALDAFDRFLAGLPAGVQLFSLFEANPQLIDLLVDIAGTTPELAHYLSRNASVFDAVIAGDFFAPWPGRAALEAELSKRLAAESDYERKLDAARRWQKDWHFRIGVHHLRGLVGADDAGTHYAELAEAVVGGVWPEVIAQFATKHGAPPGRGAVVVGMGSLGAAKLNATSDLDLIVIYDAAGIEASEGHRPLPARAYYARLTQALVTALTAPMAEGRLYEVDMRLRPSGNQGPVATGWSAFCSYQREEAWVWEHLALTRARPIVGPGALADDIEAFRRALLAEKGARGPVLSAVADMRRRIAEAKRPDGAFDTKIGPGRLQEIELVAQAGSLMAANAKRDVASGLAAGVAIGWLDAADEAALGHAYRLCWSVLQALRLLGARGAAAEDMGEDAARFVLRAAGAESLPALREALEAATTEAACVIDARLAGYDEEKGEPGDGA